MNDSEKLTEKCLLNYMSEKFVSAMGCQPEDPVSCVINWLNKRDRLQFLLKSKVSASDLKQQFDIPTHELNYYESIGLISDIGSGEYILTLKGMLKGINMVSKRSFDENDLLEQFIHCLFKEEIKSINKDKNTLNSIEKIWLFSMIILNSFNKESSIDVLNNEFNKKTYVELYNKIGDFFKELTIIDQYKPICEKEILRRELENINKKIYFINFNKERKSFYIDIETNPNKKEIIYKLLKKIFEDNIKTKSDLDRIFDFVFQCKSYLYKFERKTAKKVIWEKNIDEALNCILF